jgi:hypothetical protein
MNQEASIYLLVLIYFTRYFKQVEGNVKATFQLLQETTLGWTISGGTPAVIHEPQHTFLLREENSLEQNLNRFLEVEPVESCTMSAEQQACEEHFLAHTTQQPDL